MNKTRENARRRVRTRNVAEELRSAEAWVRQQERRVELAQNSLRCAQDRVKELEGMKAGAAP